MTRFIVEIYALIVFQGLSLGAALFYCVEAHDATRFLTGATAGYIGSTLIQLFRKASE